MKTIRNVILHLLVILSLSCEKDTIKDFDYDCYQKQSIYNKEEVITNTYTLYYKDDKLVKREFSGTYELFNYDSRGNVIRYENSSSINLSKFNDENRKVQTDVYNKSGVIDYSIYFDYIDTLLIETYNIKNGDTLNTTKYYYNYQMFWIP